MTNKYQDIEKLLGVEFKDKSLLASAITHRSYLNEHRENGLQNNERLEFLGDAVLELIISSYLFKNHPEKPEGELTSIRAAIVRTESLAEESRKLSLGQFLLMSKGEEESGGKDKDYLLANMFESILGAIYVDQEYEACKLFIERTILTKVEEIILNNLYIDSKTKAQEIIQATFKVTPEYIVIKEEGPDHDKIFTVALKVGNKVLGEGSGTSKQKAEEEAARKTLIELEKSDNSLK